MIQRIKQKLDLFEVMETQIVKYTLVDSKVCVMKGCLLFETYI